MNTNSIRSLTIIGIIWSFAERILAQFVGVIVSIILARLLLPEQYGIVALVSVMISICNVFVTTGFSTALVQKKEADDIDFSSVFYFGFFISCLLYGVIFIAAPFVGAFYKYEELASVIRVMGISIIISSVKSVEHSYISRKMDFKKFFWSTLGGTLLSAIIGIAMAYLGYGVWALVAQHLINESIDTIILWFTAGWRPVRAFSMERIKQLLRFGSKVLASSLLFTIYENLRTLIIGKVYTSTDLAYYDKGKSFPNLVVSNINSAFASSLLPAMSRLQDNPELMKRAIKRFIQIASYVIVPLLVGLAVVSKQLVMLLLGERWMGCVPFLQLLCISYAFLPLQQANTQAVMALGRSDISLKAEIIKRISNIVLILVTFRISVMALVIAEVVSTFVSMFINILISQKLFKYGFFEQIKDMAKPIVLSMAMGVVVWGIGLLEIPGILMILFQVLVGVGIYLGLSILTHNESLHYIWRLVSGYLKQGTE